jgi:hypothetical protein
MNNIDKESIKNLNIKGDDIPTTMMRSKTKSGSEYVSTLSWKKDGLYISRPNNAPNNIVYNENGDVISQSWCVSEPGNDLFDVYMENVKGPASIFTVKINDKIKNKYFYYLKGICQNDKIEKFIKENNIDENYYSGGYLDLNTFTLYQLNHQS